jgi:hypothetical protein
MLNRCVISEKMARAFNEGLSRGDGGAIWTLLSLLAKHREVLVSPLGQVQVAPIVNSQYSKAGLLGGASQRTSVEADDE